MKYNLSYLPSASFLSEREERTYQHRFSLFLVSIALMLSFSAQSQKVSVADSLWCDNLDNIIRCASLDLILEPVGKDVHDSTYIAAMMPRTRLTRSAVELISKEHNKVNYMSYVYSTGKPDKNLEAEFDKWYKKIKACLPMWEDAQLPNGDKTLSAYKDRFFTNSEDETTVRLDIVRTDGYHVRIRIY